MEPENYKDDIPFQDLKKQLTELKSQCNSLQQKVDDLEAKLDSSSVEKQTPSVTPASPVSESFRDPQDRNKLDDEQKKVSEETVAAIAPNVISHDYHEDINARAGGRLKSGESATTVKKLMDAESNFGRFWLNKIGIIVFTLGIGFLISYTFKYATPLLKIAFGYVVSVGLFCWGNKFDKTEAFQKFGRVLLGGGWALTYFTTYAMHHFEASRIIQSQVLDLFLLAVVVCGMIAHALSYKSENMTSVALFVAYLTSTLGQITSFTFLPR